MKLTTCPRLYSSYNILTIPQDRVIKKEDGSIERFAYLAIKPSCIVSNEEIDFSRYNYFYATYLLNIGKIEQAKKVVNFSLKLYPRNLLLNQYKLDLNNGKYENNFHCQNLSNIVAEIFYITANVLSSQDIYTFSNFYLNTVTSFF